MANASSTQKGVASFNATNFTVTAGVVTSNALTVTAGTGLTGGGSVNLGGSTTISLSTPVSVPNGGTGDTTLTLNGVLYGNGTSAIGITAQGATNTVLLGNGGIPSFGIVPNGALQNSSITFIAGPNVTLSPASPATVALGSSLTISVSGFGLSWSDQSTNFAASANNGYFCTATLTVSLPIDGSSLEGDSIAIYSDVANPSVITITAAAGQKIRISNNISSSAGSAANTLQGDSLLLVYRKSSLTWNAISVTGGWNLS